MDFDSDKKDADESKNGRKELEKPEVKKATDNGLHMEPEAPIIFNSSSQFGVLHPDEQILHVSQLVGKDGGTIEVGGCKVVIPPGAIDKDVEIKLFCSYNEQFDTAPLPTPLLICCPLKLNFRKEVKITLPVYFKNDSEDFLEVEIYEPAMEKVNETRKVIAKEWLKPTTVQFVFFIQQFSAYNAVLTGIYKKSSKVAKKRQDKEKSNDLLKFQTHQQTSLTDPESDRNDAIKLKSDPGEVGNPEMKEGDEEPKAPDMFSSLQIGTLNPDVSKQQVLHVSQEVGKDGGTIEVGGCKIVIPPDAIDKDVKIKLFCFYKEQSRNAITLTPVLICCPLKIKFKKEVEIMLPVLVNIESEDFCEVNILEAAVDKENVDHKIFSKQWLSTTDVHIVFSILEFSGYSAVLTGRYKKPSKFVRKNHDEEKLDDLLKLHKDVSGEVSQGIVALEHLAEKLTSINMEAALSSTYNTNNLEHISKINSNPVSQQFNWSNKDQIDTKSEDPDGEQAHKEKGSSNIEDDVPEITEQELRQEFQLFWSTRKTIGKDGGTIQVAGCEVLIPIDALEKDVEIEIAAFDERKNKNSMHLTPLLQCKPHGLKFKKDVKISLPTCYSAEGKSSFIVRKIKTWNEYDVIGSGLVTSEKSYRFTVDRFSIYDIVPLGVQDFLDWRKEITLVLAVTPDTNEDPNQIDAHVLFSNNFAVHLDGLNQVIKTTFDVLYSDVLSVQITGEGVMVDRNAAENAEKVWGRSRVEKTFLVTRQNQESVINTKIKLTVKSAHHTLHDDHHTITAYHLAPPRSSFSSPVYNIDAPRAHHLNMVGVVHNDTVCEVLHLGDVKTVSSCCSKSYWWLRCEAVVIGHVALVESCSCIFT